MEEVRIDKLQFKFTTDKGNGWKRCTIFVNGKNYGSTAGGNYDLKGVALGNFMKRKFLTEFKKLDATDLYGLEFVDPASGKRYNTWKRNYRISLDGAKGFDTMVEVLEALGYILNYNKETKASVWYTMEKKQ